MHPLGESVNEVKIQECYKRYEVLTANRGCLERNQLVQALFLLLACGLGVWIHLAWARRRGGLISVVTRGALRGLGSLGA